MYIYITIHIYGAVLSKLNLTFKSCSPIRLT